MPEKQRSPLPFILIICGGVLLIIVALLMVKQDAPTTPTSATTPTPATSAEEGTYPEIERIDLDASKAAFDAGSAIFLDVRSAGAYAASHIPGALSIPLTELETRLGELDPNQKYITYCT